MDIAANIGKFKFHADCSSSMHPLGQHQIRAVFLTYEANIVSHFLLAIPLYAPQRGVINHGNRASGCTVSF